MLLLGASRVACPAVRAACGPLADAIAADFDSGRMQALLMRSRRNRSAARFPAVVLRLAGRPNPTIEALLAGSEIVPENEAVPFRLAERRWISALAGCSVMLGDPFVAGSIFDGDPNVLEMDRMDLYAITHWAAYATDMGCDRAPETMRAFVARRLRGAIAWQLAEEDFDLLGEVLMAARMLRLPPVNETLLAWEVLRSAWDEFGFLPSPTFHAPDFEALTGVAQEAYSAAHIYHTNFVFGLLCAAELGVQSAEPVADGTPIPARVAAEDARTAVGRAGPYCNSDLLNGIEGIAPREAETAYWQTVVAGKPDADRLMLEARLIRSVRKYDLADIARTIESWMLANTPVNLTFVEAVRFLARQQVPDGAIGAHFLERQNLVGQQAVLITTVLTRLLNAAADYLDTAASSSVAMASERTTATPSGQAATVCASEPTAAFKSSTRSIRSHGKKTPSGLRPK